MPPPSIYEYDYHLGYHPEVVPLDIRLGLTSPPAEGDDDALRWGIMATGKVAHDFAQVLKFLCLTNGRHALLAVGSRTQARADEFAALHSKPFTPTAHGSYEELCADPYVDLYTWQVSIRITVLMPRWRSAPANMCWWRNQCA